MFLSDLPGLPEIKFTFSEEITDGDEIQYFGEVQFEGEEYLGAIITDNNGFLIDYDFYNVSDDINDYRLQDVVEGLEYEIKHFFQEEVLPKLKKNK